MEVDQEEIMVLRGDRDIAHEVKLVDYEALEGSIKPNASTSTAEAAILPLLGSSHKEILSLSLSFTPAPSVDLDLFLAGFKDSSSLPIVFTYSKGASKTPHTLSINSLPPHSSTLIELAALDPTCSLAQRWITTHTPPPLTKAGQKFKNVKSAAAQRAKQRGSQIKVPVLGGGGLLDALIVLNTDLSSGLILRGRLSFQQGEFTINLQAFVEPIRFYPLPFSRAKQLVLERLFPRSTSSTLPDSATIDWFYSSLRRAPITRDGLVLNLPNLARPQVVETQEERDARLRREAKGKSKAIENPFPPPLLERQQVDEDVLLRPRGLRVELLPFQSRSVRWMLAREGRVCKVLRGDDLAQALDDEKKEKVSRKDQKKLQKESVSQSKTKGKGNGNVRNKGKKKKVEEESQSSEEDEEFSEDEEYVQRVVLQDLDAEELAKMKRGPLWQKQRFEIRNENKMELVEVWLNRVTGQLSQIDPLDINSQEEGGGKEGDHIGMELDEENEEDKEGKEDDVNRVVGGLEGHGLLADEVGTGKTVTTVSLILLHTDPLRRKLPLYTNLETDAQVQPTGLTLIVCPTAISGQWSQELARLAPGLRVLRYEGVKSLKTTFTPAYIAKSYDIVLTTFDVLRKEVAIARKPHVRTLRNQKQIKPRYRRSLLVEIDWMRVVADETQMVGDAFSATSETLSLIPRQYSWAVTSTPLRDKIEDVRPLLTYLRVEPIASTKSSFARLLEEPECFKRLFEEVGERTLKSQVQNEMFLPKQTRLIVPLDFTAVERFYYDTRYSEMLQALGLASDGTPREQVDRRTGQLLKWQPDKAEMNRWLGILRALSAHPQVGSAGRQALGHVLKTVEEVYTSMREQAVSAIQTDQRAILATRVKKAQLLMWDKDIEDRFESALELFKEVVEKVEPIIEGVTKEVHAAWKDSRKSRSDSSSPATMDVGGALQIGFANEIEKDKDSLSDRERATARSLSGLRNRLRDLLFVKHSALFFSGHAYFNMKKEEQETEAYAAAEKLRQTLLQSYEDHVEKAQTNLLATLEERDKEDVLEVTDLELPFNDAGHGIVALTVYEDIEITSDILNGYAELIFQYRQMIIDMILKTVSIAGDNATGEEYEERAVLQEKLEVYIEAYTVLLGEWCYGILGTRSTLADQFKAEQSAIFFVEENLLRPPSPQQTNGRKRKAKKAQLDSSDEEEEDAEVVQKKATRVQKKRNANIKHNSIKDFRPPTLETGFSPAEVLRYELLVERIEAKGEDREFSELTPLRHLIKKLKDAAELSNRDVEIALLERERKRISQALGPLEEVADRLRSELTSFTTAFNARLLYFKNLQSISDSVADPDMNGAKWRGLLVELEDLRLQEKDLVDQLEEKEKRKRYLDNLNNPDDEEEHICPICAEAYNDGVLLACVHLICRSCFKNWHSRSATCPLCKAKVEDRSWQSVKYRRKGKKNAERKGQEGENDDEDQGLDDGDEKKLEQNQDLHAFKIATPALAQLPQSEIDEINSIENAAMLSTKANSVVSLTKLLRRRDPEAKVVIFSVWQEALSLLMESFNRNGLQFVRLEGSSAKGKREGVVKRFQEDPDVAAFFLHTRSQSAGLTLTCSRYMILLEPLLAPQLEVQACARIWRIGQTKETTVYNFQIQNTSDERISELRARNKTSLFVAREEDQIEGRESTLGQQQSLASKEARSRTKNEASAEALDDEDEIAQCLLTPEHYIALQKALLRLNGPLPPLPVAQAPAHDGEEDQEMGIPGIAAAGRVANEAEGSGAGGELRF